MARLSAVTSSDSPICRSTASLDHDDIVGGIIDQYSWGNGRSSCGGMVATVMEGCSGCGDGGERLGTTENFLDQLFDHNRGWHAATSAASDRAQVMAWMLEGGFPEIVRDQLTPRQRSRWFDAYTDDVTNRQALRPVAEACYEHELRRLLRALAARIGTELVIADLARDLGLDRTTITNYVSILEAVYLLSLLPAFRPARPSQPNTDRRSTSSTQAWQHTSTVSANETSRP